jgi:hypothetical protein
MRKAFLSLAAAIIAFGVPALAVSPASADGPLLGCNIQPSGTTAFTAGHCDIQRAAASFTVDYLVQGVTGTATYSWTPPVGTIVAGCTSTNPDCELTVHHGSARTRTWSRPWSSRNQGHRPWRQRRRLSPRPAGACSASSHQARSSTGSPR